MRNGETTQEVTSGKREEGDGELGSTFFKWNVKDWREYRDASVDSLHSNEGNKCVLGSELHGKISGTGSSE